MDAEMMQLNQYSVCTVCAALYLTGPEAEYCEKRHALEALLASYSDSREAVRAVSKERRGQAMNEGRDGNGDMRDHRGA